MKHSEEPTRKSRRFGRVVWICLAVVWILATVGGYLFLDPVVSRRLWDHPNTWHKNSWVDGFRQLGRGGLPIWLAAVWSCLTDKWRPTIVIVVAMILVGVSVCPLKALVRRARPSQAFPAAFGQAPEVPWQRRGSFPSGDTAVAFAVATTLSLPWGRLWTPTLFVAATAIGVLRVTAFAHYPSDVMAGAMIGVLCGMVAIGWAGRWRPPDAFQVAGRWRLAVAVVLIFVLPFFSPYIGMSTSLQVFLKRYAILLIAATLVWLGAVRLRARKPESTRIALDRERVIEEGVDS
jgi:undecaprenyl-diphosphatase